MTRPTGTPQPPPGPEPDPVAAAARLFLGQLLAVVAIAAVITLVVTLFGWGSGPGVRTTGPGAPRDTGATTAGASTSAPPTTAAPPATTPPGSSTPPAPGTTATSPTGPSAGAGATDDPATRPRVDVLNQSADDGAAERTASRLRAAGWRIGRVDDFRGTVVTTTVYFPRRLRTDAEALARALPGAPRLRERLSTLSPRRLSVVLVD